MADIYGEIGIEIYRSCGMIVWENAEQWDIFLASIKLIQVIFWNH